ncbi:MAG: hypothetical protein OET90_09830, partial [Desulfuromonadales bacterium]|nr:hypothetical protein [Desulfuromonadales bacterium]
LEDFDMPHMPTLGSAYEEVTRQGIDQAFSIPEHMNLNVVSGFISVGGEMLPEQIDCMLIHGEGEKYGLTEQYICPIEIVLCIFEVKKTLRKSDYIDAFDHLSGIRRKFSEYFEKKLINDGFEPDISIARRVFSQITGKVAPECYMDIHRLSKSDGILFYTLVQESIAPISIIHGYGGYKTEHGLRSAFINILLDKRESSGHGLGIPSIPSLVTSNRFCLIKGNGIPYLVMQGKGSWVAVASTRYNSARIILEIIWSKISIYFHAIMPCDDGLQIENLQPLLIAQAKETDDLAGWEYTTAEFKESSLRRENNIKWKPVALGKAEIAAVNIMAMQGGYLPLDDGMQEYLSDTYNVTLENVVGSLLSSREFMRDGDCIRPLNQLTHIVHNDDGTGFVSSDQDLLDLWCRENDIEPSYFNLIFME